MSSRSFYRFTLKWGPALLVMLVIFIFSATPSYNLPNFGLWDTLVKKASHMIVYALLALAILRGLGHLDRRAFVILLLWIILYAACDEFHQSFTPGRHPSVVDVGIDTVGGLVGTGLWSISRSLKRIVAWGNQG